jgi:hypothetical protein
MSTVKTTIVIKGQNNDDTKSLWDLFNNIFGWVEKMHPDIAETDNEEVGRYYLKSIALHSGAIPDIDSIATYGYINKWTLSPSRSELEIKQTTFDWQEAVMMWDLISKKFVPSASVTYKSICESSEDFSTNIPEYADSYVVKTKDQYIERASKDYVENLLSKRYKGSFNEMFASYSARKPACFSISKWDIVPISETV